MSSTSRVVRVHYHNLNFISTRNVKINTTLLFLANIDNCRE
jgi:hypothetical protein